MTGTAKSVNSTLASNIGLARKRAAFSIEELARELEVSPRSIYNWERGLVQPRGKHLRALAATLNRDIAWFFDEGELEPAA